MGSAGQLVGSSRRRGPSHRGDEQPAIPDGVAWLVLVVTVVSRSVLATIVALLLWSVLPNLVGLQTTTVMSGSMAPRLMVGDAVVVRHVSGSELARGQVLLVDDPDRPGRLRLHRLVAVQDDGRLVTRGDANRSRDSSTVDIDAVHGAAFLRIPYAGLPSYWLRTGRPLPLIGLGLLVVLLAGGVRLGRLLEDDEDRRRRRHRGVRLRGLHRATAVSIALVVMSCCAAAPSAAAGYAGYSATSATGGSTWGTTCGDQALSTGVAPQLSYGYAPGTGSSDVRDLGTVGDTGTLRGGVSRSTCTNGWSPFVTFDGLSGVVTASKLRSHPSTTTIATWFRVAPGNAGGVLADFGSSNTATASTGVDQGLYMGDNGTLTFAASSVQVSGLVMTAFRYCTTAAGYADGTWHLVVATLSLSGCSITVDARSSTTVTVPFVLTVSVAAYSGYWRFGYDNATGGTNAPTRLFFRGDLDETQIYDSAVAFPVQTRIFANGHGGPSPN